MPDAHDKENELFNILSTMQSVLVAFSGGVDSTYLAWAAHRALGPRALAVTVSGPAVPEDEVAGARTLAASIGISHLALAGDELADAGFRANTPLRCYHCKKVLFTMLKEIAAQQGLDEVVTGDNADDRRDYRPGRRAAREMGIRHPLAEAGLSKEEIRELSRLAGLPTADRPPMACLASRVPYGTEISEELLRRIAAGEEFLRGLGLRQYRLRHHGNLCRIEVAPEDIELLARGPARQKLVEAMKALGYAYVTLDLQGYRSGAMNEVLDPTTKEAT